jgi:hypothetical protein
MRSAHGTTKLVTDYGAMETARKGISKYKEALEQLFNQSFIRNADD